MRIPTRHARGLATAVAALALSAGVAMAAGGAGGAGAVAPSDDASDGLSRASEAAGMIVPVIPDPAIPSDPGQAPDGNADPAVDHPEDVERPLNHGWYVSQAAQADTPAEFDNHGAYVSSVAKGDLGKPDGATAAGDRGAAGLDKATAAKARNTERQAARP